MSTNNDPRNFPTGRDLVDRLQALETAVVFQAGAIQNLRTELLVVKALVAEIAENTKKPWEDK